MVAIVAELVARYSHSVLSPAGSTRPTSLTLTLLPLGRLGQPETIDPALLEALLSVRKDFCSGSRCFRA